MSKVRNLPEIVTMSDADLLYTVEVSVGPNAGRKATVATLRGAMLEPSAVKVAYEDNADTNAFTDAEKAKLATVTEGATFQEASEIPYDNSETGISATNVQAAIDEVIEEAQADFRPSIISGRILHYSGGTARFDDVFFSLLSGDILLNPNVTFGEVYVDLDGLVKQTASGINAPPLSIVFAKFSTDLNDIISLVDQRVKNTQNLVRGTVDDVRDVRAGAAASAGSSGRLSDAMHKHDILTAAPSTQLASQGNSEGTSDSLARADHIHNLPTSAPTDILKPSVVNAEGLGTNFSRNDHTHAIATGLVGDVSTIQPDDAASAGVADSFSRADHKHAIATAAAASIDTSSTNTEGVSTSFARADHTHATTILNQVASATVDDTSISLTDVLIAGMTLTPTAGTYLVTFSSSVLNSGNGATRLFVSIYSGGTQVAHSEREIGVSGAANSCVQSGAIVTVNGSQAIEARWRAVAGTNTAHERSLVIVRLGA